MQDFLKNVVSGIGVLDILDILIVAFIIYNILEFIKETRAEQLIKGLLVLGSGVSGTDQNCPSGIRTAG